MNRGIALVSATDIGYTSPPDSDYTANGLKLFPRTIACRSNETCNKLFTNVLRRVSATSSLHQTTNFTAFPVYSDFPENEDIAV